MNDVIENLARSNAEFSSIILAYAIERYEPGYNKLLNNIHLPCKMTEALCQEYKSKDILGQIPGKNDFILCFSESNIVDEYTFNAGILQARKDSLDITNNNGDDTNSSDDEAIELKLKGFWQKWCPMCFKSNKDL